MSQTVKSKEPGPCFNFLLFWHILSAWSILSNDRIYPYTQSGVGGEGRNDRNDTSQRCASVKVLNLLRKICFSEIFEYEENWIEIKLEK